MSRRRSFWFWTGVALVLATLAGLTWSAADVDGSPPLSLGMGGLFAVLVAWSASATHARGAVRRGFVAAFAAPVLGSVWLAVWMVTQTAHVEQRPVLEVLGAGSGPDGEAGDGQEQLGVFVEVDPATSVLAAVVVVVGVWCAVLGPVLRKHRGEPTSATTRIAMLPFAVLAAGYLLVSAPVAALVAAISALWLVRFLRRDGVPDSAPTEPPPAAA